MRCAPPSMSACKPAKPDDAQGLAELVRSYRVHNQPNSLNELEFFRKMPSFEVAIYHAGLAINRRDKRFSHQYRIPLAVLSRAKSLLAEKAPRLKTCRSFHELHACLTKALASVRGIGELYTYDTALRLGAFLNLKPEHVYLHAGTRAGARALGFSVAAGYVEFSALPKAIQVLQPHEVEDFLCIYKAHLQHGS